MCEFDFFFFFFLFFFFFFFFFFNDTATTEIYTLSLHDALPISRAVPNDDLGARDPVVELGRDEVADDVTGGPAADCVRFAEPAIGQVGQQLADDPRCPLEEGGRLVEEDRSCHGTDGTPGGCPPPRATRLDGPGVTLGDLPRPLRDRHSRRPRGASSVPSPSSIDRRAVRRRRHRGSDCLRSAGAVGTGHVRGGAPIG